MEARPAWPGEWSVMSGRVISGPWGELAPAEHERWLGAGVGCRPPRNGVARRAGCLLPKPEFLRGRGSISRWRPMSVTLARFVREQRAQGYKISEIRPRIILAFGERIFEVLPEPRESRTARVVELPAPALPRRSPGRMIPTVADVAPDRGQLPRRALRRGRGWRSAAGHAHLPHGPAGRAEGKTTCAEAAGSARKT